MSMIETLYATVLDGVYESMPSLPGLVLTARLLNRQQKREDTPQNSFEAIMEMTRLLCSIDLELLEKKHYENTSEFPGQPAPPKRSIVAGRVDAQLAEVAELDKRLRAANESLKAAMDDHRRIVGESRKMLSEFGEANDVFSGGVQDIFGGGDFPGQGNPWLLTRTVDWSEGGIIGDLMRQFTVDGTRTTPSNSPENLGAAASHTNVAAATVAAAGVSSTPVVAVSGSDEEQAPPPLSSSQPATDNEPDTEMPPRPTRLRRSRSMPPRPTRLRRSRRFDAADP